MKHKLIELVERQQIAKAPDVTAKQAELQKTTVKRDLPKFAIGDTVEVHHWIELGEKGRTQIFAGVVISRKGEGTRERFTYEEYEGRATAAMMPTMATVTISSMSVKP